MEQQMQVHDGAAAAAASSYFLLTEEGLVGDCQTENRMCLVCMGAQVQCGNEYQHCAIMDHMRWKEWRRGRLELEHAMENTQLTWWVELHEGHRNCSVCGVFVTEVHCATRKHTGRIHWRDEQHREAHISAAIAAGSFLPRVPPAEWGGYW